MTDKVCSRQTFLPLLINGFIDEVKADAPEEQEEFDVLENDIF